jgi:hypothetical protein
MYIVRLSPWTWQILQCLFQEFRVFCDFYFWISQPLNVRGKAKIGSIFAFGKLNFLPTKVYFFFWIWKFLISVLIGLGACEIVILVLIGKLMETRKKRSLLFEFDDLVSFLCSIKVDILCVISVFLSTSFELKLR